jgi:hypothetical protein
MGLPAVAMRDKSMPDRIEETPSAAGVNQAAVSGIFRKDCRIGEIREPPQVVCPAKSAPKRFP